MEVKNGEALCDHRGVCGAWCGSCLRLRSANMTVMGRSTGSRASRAAAWSYTIENKEPTEISVLLLGGMKMSLIDGPTVTVTDESGYHMEVGVIPERWRSREIFLHVPQNFIFKRKGKEAEAEEIHYFPQYAILIKTRSREHHAQTKRRGQ
jgi:hypothetical protein